MNNETWQNTEPWVSIEGALWDVKGGASEITKAMQQIKNYVDNHSRTLLAEEKAKVVEEIGKKLPQAFGWEVVKGGREQVRDDPAHEFGYDVALFEIHKMLNLLSNSHKGHEN